MSDNADKTQQGRKKLRINFDEADRPVFPGIAKTAYITSNELCKLVSELMKSVFVDFEGCFFEATSGGEPTISLLFNHGMYEDNQIVACERVGGKKSGNGVLDRTRNRDRQLNEGDRYSLTEDGKDIIESILNPRMYNNGNIDWKRITSEWTDRSAVNIYNTMPAQQYTKVSFIDLKRVCALIYGSKKDGDEVAYDVRIAAPLTPMGYGFQQQQMVNMNYMLNIICVSATQLSKIYEKLGYGGIGAQIIRG